MPIFGAPVGGSASDSLETARQELGRFFDEGDYFEYDTPLFDYLYASDEV